MCFDNVKKKMRKRDYQRLVKY